MDHCDDSAIGFSHSFVIDDMMLRKIKQLLWTLELTFLLGCCLTNSKCKVAMLINMLALQICKQMIKL